MPDNSFAPKSSSSYSSSSSNSTPRSSSSSSSSSYAPRILLRQVSSIFLVILLYTAASPFNPISWLTGPIFLSGTYFLDRLFAGILLFSSFYFQWRIASVRSDAAITLPVLAGFSNEQYIQNGRIRTGNNNEPGQGLELWRWRVSEYWHFALAEGAALVIAEFGGSEILRRVLVGGIVGVLWVVGWNVTPRQMKRWAWEQIKVFLWVLVLDEVRRVGTGFVGGLVGGGGNNRRRARW
ncbi:hypothetical protein QBC43DRAFT_359940 [Cladorrhinum sp. PSN259]|nr:hypothetical protein QBC43DRAFT_359940 [Cladorrhinum sp. PSN259]